MMKGTTVETISIAGTTFNPPTLLGRDESTAGSYLNGHPVGPDATISCGGQKGWDCTINADGSVTFAGPKGRAFIADYLDVTAGDGPLNHLVKVPGSTVNGTKVTSKSWITCTTCHDQHDMPYFSTANGAVKPTRFFVRGWYNPGSSAASNSAAQFCRTCHADKSNEAKGRMVPTT
jgi:cytochrome c553